MVGTMAADDSVTQGAKASAIILRTQFAGIMQVMQSKG